MSQRHIMTCDGCGVLHDSPERAFGWSWTQRRDGVAESYDLCGGCLDKIIGGRKERREAKEKTVTTRRKDWHYDSQGYCDNPGRGY